MAADAFVALFIADVEELEQVEEEEDVDMPPLLCEPPPMLLFLFGADL
jgi:hypothetical protein